MDGFYPSRTGIRYHHACGAEDGNPAETAEPGVPGFLRQRRAAVDRDGDGHVAIAAMILGGFRDGCFDHFARGRIDCRLADRQWQPIAGDRAHPVAGPEFDAVSICFQGNVHPDQGAVGYVGVVACVRSGGEAVSPSILRGRGRMSGSPFGSEIFGIGEFPGQRRICGLCRRGHAGIGGPATAQFSFELTCHS